jgi:hypothetical protein
VPRALTSPHEPSYSQPEAIMKAQPSQDDDVTLFDEEMDDLEAWTPQDLEQFGSSGVSRIADLAE